MWWVSVNVLCGVVTLRAHAHVSSVISNYNWSNELNPRMRHTRELRWLRQTDRATPTQPDAATGWIGRTRLRATTPLTAGWVLGRRPAWDRHRP